MLVLPSLVCGHLHLFAGKDEPLLGWRDAFLLLHSLLNALHLKQREHGARVAQPVVTSTHTSLVRLFLPSSNLSVDVEPGNDWINGMLTIAYV